VTVSLSSDTHNKAQAQWTIFYVWFFGFDWQTKVERIKHPVE